MLRPLRVLAVFGASLWFAASAHSAIRGAEPCPESGYFGYVNAAGSPNLVLEQRGIAAAAESSVVDTVPANEALFFPVVRRAWFALPRGEFGHGFSPCIYFACEGEAIVDERFVVAGLPAGTRVDLRVRLDLELRVDMQPCLGDCDFTVSSRIEFPGGIDWRGHHVRAPAGLTHEAWSHEVLIRVHAGEEFPLRFGLFTGSPDGLNSVETAARWSFPGLPAGAQVDACLAQQVPTAARVTTWGALKSTYR